MPTKNRGYIHFLKTVMKTAVITGASGEIGIQIVKTFIKDGYFCIAQYNKNGTALDNLRKELEKENLSDYLFCVKADFSKSDGYKKVIKALDGFKHVDALINCAGVSLYSECRFTTLSELERVMNVNFISSYMLTSSLIDKLSLLENGKVLFISSIWGKCGGSLESAYSASKSALIGLTKSLAKELAPKINVNCIAPGVIDTKMNGKFDKNEIDDLISRTPLARLGKPSDVADLALYLCSDKASFITGETITVDGGFTL